MASYQGHLAAASVLGAAYGGLGYVYWGLDWGPAFLAAGLTALGGLMPDLDSDSGVPVRELFNVAAVGEVDIECHDRAFVHELAVDRREHPVDPVAAQRRNRQYVGVARLPDGEPLPLIVRKADGGCGYAATDLAAIRYRVRELGAERILYVVGAPQRTHFRMVFAVAEAAGVGGVRSWPASPPPGCGCARPGGRRRRAS